MLSASTIAVLLETEETEEAAGNAADQTKFSFFAAYASSGLHLTLFIQIP